MSREILFKAKWLDNGEWVEGDLLRETNAFGEKLVQIFVDDSNGYWSKYEVDPSTVCQYTGLTDNTGKRIFEGDILECSDDINDIGFYAVVEFGNPNCGYDWGFQLRHLKGDKPNMDILCWVDMKETHAFCDVVGNIFDNPELPEGGTSDGWMDKDN